MRIKDLHTYQKRVIIALVIIVSVGYFPLKNYLKYRDIKRLAIVILKNWKDNNLTANYAYWKDPMSSPPIYGLNSYTIIKTIILKKNNITSAQVYLLLDFPEDNLMPSGKTWILEFYKFPRIGWLVVDFKEGSP